MRRVSANYIYPVSGPPLKNGIVEFDSTGKILKLIDTNSRLRETAGLEFYNGIITPGFVNTHCHLELSYMKNQIPEKCGLDQFVSHLTEIRTKLSHTIPESIKKAHNEMIRNGIVAVGDISNTSDSFEFKSGGKIKYHTFLEIFGRKQNNAAEIIQQAVDLSNLILEKFQHQHSIVPHSPYSVSAELLNEINSLSDNNPVTIHNQESLGEILLFKEKKGPLYEILNRMVPELKNWAPEQNNSLDFILAYLNKPEKLLLVHNTYTIDKDIVRTKSYNGEIYWILCPNANLYIENKLPDIPAFLNKNENIALGTDSLASNHHLSILEEMKTISEYFPEVSLNEIIKWATLNGARALNMDSELGSIEKNKTPGLNLICDLNLPERKLTKNTRVTKIC